MIGKIIVGLIIATIGFMPVWKTEWFLINFGRIGFAEKYLGYDGGSRLMYKIIGTIIIMIGFLYVTGLHEPLILWVVHSIFRIK